MRSIYKWDRVLFCISCLAGCLLQSTEVYASHPSNTNLHSDKNSWFMGIGGGTTWINLPDNTTVLNGVDSAPPPSNQDSYSINNPSANNWQLFVGYRWFQESIFLPYYNVFFQYRHYMNTDIKGNIDQFSLPEFVNYHYKMSYEADLFTLTGKVNLVEYKSFLPYVSAGIGAIINHVNDYNETALADVTPRISPDYNGNSQTKLAVTLGAGLDYILTDNYWLTLGYEHVFQGDIKSGTGVDSWSNTALSFGNVKMDTVFLSISANFPQGFGG